jgi:gliding motility-associated-like protein
VTFNSSGSTIDNTATAEYAWTFGDGGTATTASPTHTYTVVSGSVTPSLVIRYTGVNNCSDNFSVAPFAVSAATSPTIVADPVVTELCPNRTISVQLTVPETFDSYSWSNSQTGATITVKQPGTYTVQTTSANGCLGTAEIVFTEKPGCAGGEGPDIEVLKAFTPNGDGMNDTWQIVGIENLSSDCELNVFDGRGKRVFNTKISALPLEGWNGTSGGAELPAGTYYYVFGCPEGKPVTGSVLIAR